MVLTYFNICVGITNLFVLLPVFGMFFCSHSCIRTYRHPRIVVSSLTYEKDCVRCFFNSLLWVWSCHAAWALTALRKSNSLFTLVLLPAIGKWNVFQWEWKGEEICTWGQSAPVGLMLLRSVFFWGLGFGVTYKKKIRFEACLDKEH